MHEFATLLLAGGKGSRMGMPKGLLEYNGRPWIEQQLQVVSEVEGMAEAVVILGHGSDDYTGALPWMKAAIDEWVVLGGINVRVVINPHPDDGQFSSMMRGARFLLRQARSKGTFVLPVDVPAAKPMTWAGLSRELRGGIRACIPEWNGCGGHPVLLATEFMSELASKPADSRLDAEMRRQGVGLVKRVQVDDPRVCLNINFPNDWNTFSRGEWA